MLDNVRKIKLKDKEAIFKEKKKLNGSKTSYVNNEQQQIVEYLLLSFVCTFKK